MMVGSVVGVVMVLAVLMTMIVMPMMVVIISFGVGMAMAMVMRTALSGPIALPRRSLTRLAFDFDVSVAASANRAHHSTSSSLILSSSPAVT